MSDPVNLNVRRAAKTGDCRDMSVRDLLEDMLTEVEKYGWEKIVVAVSRPADANGEFMVDARMAGCNTLEARGLMATWFGRGEMDE